MARESDFQRLMREGKIKSNSQLNRIYVNQDAQNEIMRDNAGGESVLREIQAISGFERVNLTHTKDIFSSDELSSLSSSISLDAGESSLRFNQEIDVSQIKALAQEKFDKNIIGISLEREQKVLNLFRKSFYNIKDKMDVLDFLNNTGQYGNLEGKVVRDIQDLRRTVVQEYSKLTEQEIPKDLTITPGKNSAKATYRITSTPAEIESLRTTLGKKLEKFNGALESKILDAPQFLGLLQLVKGELLPFLQKNNIEFIGGIGKKQLLEGVTTAFEFIENVNMTLYFLKNQAKGVNVTVASTGSQTSKEFANNLTNISSFEGLQEGYLKTVQERAANGVLEGTLTGLSTITQSGSGSEESSGTDDFVFIFTSEDGVVEKVYVDAKLGAGGEYSGGIGSFKGGSITIQTLIENGISLNPSLVQEQLEIGLTMFLVSNLFGDANKDLFKEILRDVLVYAFIGSEIFIQKFRKDNMQADLAFITNQYVWFSEIFKVIRMTYFEASKMRALTISSKISESSLEEYRNIESLQNFITEYQQNTNVSGAVGKLFADFYSTGLSLELTRNVLSNLKKIR